MASFGKSALMHQSSSFTSSKHFVRADAPALRAENEVALAAIDAMENVELHRTGAELVHRWIGTRALAGRHLRVSIYRGAFTGGIRVDAETF